MAPPWVTEACIAPLHELSPAGRKTTWSLMAKARPLKEIVCDVAAKKIVGNTDRLGGDGGGVGGGAGGGGVGGGGEGTGSVGGGGEGGGGGVDGGGGDGSGGIG